MEGLPAEALAHIADHCVSARLECSCTTLRHTCKLRVRLDLGETRGPRSLSRYPRLDALAAGPANVHEDHWWALLLTAATLPRVILLRKTPFRQKTHAGRLDRLRRLTLSNTVCSFDYGILARGLVELRLDGTNLTTANCARMVGQLRLSRHTLQTLDLSCTSVGDAQLATLGALPALRELKLAATKVRHLAPTGSAFAVPQLEVLDLSCAGYHADGSLYTKRMQLQPAAAEFVWGLSGTLTQLHCGGAAMLTPCCFLGLQQCSRLVQLSLYGCTKFDDSCADALTHCTALTSLNLSRTQAGMECCRAIGMLSGLQILLLASCKHLCSHAVTCLATLTKLRILSLHSCKKVTDVAADVYQSLQALEWLDLGETKVGQATMESLACVASLPLLRGLGLSDTRVRESMLGLLAHRLGNGMVLAFANSPALIATHPISDCLEGGILSEWLKVK